MDLSLPSYGEISAPTASVGTVKSLTIEMERVPTKSRAAAKSKSSEGGGGMSINIPMSKVLPSLGKGPKKTESTKTEVASTPRPARKAMDKQTNVDDDDDGTPRAVKIMDMSMPSYGESASIKDTNPFRL